MGGFNQCLSPSRWHRVCETNGQKKWEPSRRKRGLNPSTKLADRWMRCASAMWDALVVGCRCDLSLSGKAYSTQHTLYPATSAEILEASIAVSYQGFPALLDLPSKIKLDYLRLSLTEDPHWRDNTGSCWLLICQNLVGAKNTDTRGIRRSGDIPRPCLLVLPLDFKER